MRSSETEVIFNSSSHPSYDIRVRGTTFLWGSAGITQNLTFQTPLVLHIRNDPFGEAITFGTRQAGGNTMTIGKLERGECASIQIQGISGVFADCIAESTVSCLVR